MSSFPQNATVVLVHGAWADGSGWQNIILPLSQQGLKVTSAQIPLTSLTDDMAALQRTVERIPGPAVLVAHAYGGAALAASYDERVKSLVYIAAFAPDEGETVAELISRRAPHPQAPHIAPDEHGFIWMSDEGFSNAVAHKAPEDQTTILSAVQRPISVKCIQEKAPKPAWKTKPSWFLVAEEDRMISPDTQHFMAKRMGAKVRSCQVDHSPMLTAPDLVIEVILDAARETLK